MGVIEYNRIERYSRYQQRLELFLSELQRCSIHDILLKLKLTEEQFSGVAPKHHLNDYEPNQLLEECHYMALKDFFCSRISALFRQEKLEDLSNRSKFKRVRKRSTSNKRSTSKRSYKRRYGVYEKISNNGIVGRIIYSAM